MKKLTLDRILQSQGFGSRKGCRALVRDSAVSLGGEVATSFDTLLDPEGLEFTVHGDPWVYHEHLYLVLNKPPNYECSRKPSHHPGVLSLFPVQFAWRETQPVGRLDHDTTGLLLLSDDGAFIHAHTSPKRQVPKTYHATVQDEVTDALVARMLDGVQLEDEPAPLRASSSSAPAPAPAAAPLPAVSLLSSWCAAASGTNGDGAAKHLMQMRCADG